MEVDFKGMFSELTTKEKIDLAAKLTQGAMSILPRREKSSDRERVHAASETYHVFGLILQLVVAGPPALDNLYLQQLEKLRQLEQDSH